MMQEKNWCDYSSADCDCSDWDCISFAKSRSRKLFEPDISLLGLVKFTCRRIRSKLPSDPVRIGERVTLDAVRFLIIRPLLGDFPVWSLGLRFADFSFTLRSISRDTTGPLGPGTVFRLLSWNVLKEITLFFLCAFRIVLRVN